MWLLAWLYVMAVLVLALIGIAYAPLIIAVACVVWLVKRR